MPWHPWFAWYPVRWNTWEKEDGGYSRWYNGWLWLRQVERRLHIEEGFDGDMDSWWEYRLPKKEG